VLHTYEPHPEESDLLQHSNGHNKSVAAKTEARHAPRIPRLSNNRAYSEKHQTAVSMGSLMGFEWLVACAGTRLMTADRLHETA